jgi:GT2 family glycosyltransferase
LKLSVIIVNYKSANYILDCLNSAAQFESYKEFEWIVIDNASNDNSKETICNAFPNVIWQDMGYNAGFARANNKGIKISTGDTVLLLNPDTIIIKDAIKICYSKLAKSNLIASGVQMLNPDLTPQISGSNFMKGGLNHLLPLPYWGNFLKIIAGFIGMDKPSIAIAKSEENVDWVSGAFLMVKKDIIQKAGMMDEDFFLYAEEVEWCSRLREYGKICLYGDINIIHIMGEIISKNTLSNNKSYANLFDKKGLQLILSNHVRIRKQYGIFWFLVQIINYTIAVPVYFIASFVMQLLKFKYPFSAFQNAFKLAKNVAVIWSNSITIIRNKPHFYKVL